MNALKVLFFCVTKIPTAGEQSQIDTLNNRYGVVGVRAADIPLNGSLEPADGLAGTIPAAYTAAIANYPLGVVAATPMNEMKDAVVVPAAVSIAALATTQLKAIISEIVGSDIVMSEKTSGAGITWTSATPAAATVNASGLVTGAAAGASVVTWKWIYEGSAELSLSKTSTVTVT